MLNNETKKQKGGKRQFQIHLKACVSALHYDKKTREKWGISS